MEWTPIVDCAYDADITVGDEDGSDIITVAIQLKDFEGNDLTVSSCIYAYFSDDSSGDDVVTTTFSGGIAKGTDGFYIVGAGGAGKDMHLISEADGDIDLAITETTAEHTSYLVLVMPNGKLVVSDAITFVA